jgi:hypothetical protein
VVCESIDLGERPPAGTTLGKGIHAYGGDMKRRGGEGDRESKMELDYGIYATREMDAPTVNGIPENKFQE